MWALLSVGLFLGGCGGGDVPASSPTLTPAPGTEPQSPSAEAGVDLVVDEGSVVALVGVATDPNGDIASFSWTQVAGEEAELIGANSSRADFQAPSLVEESDLVFRFTVTDAAGLSASDEVSILVLPVNLPPQASSGPDQWVYAGDLVSLSGVATDADGTVASWQWTLLDGASLVINSADEAEASFVAPATEVMLSLLFELEVTDNEGGFDRDQLIVRVQPLSAPGAGVAFPPEVDAGPDQQVFEQQSVTLSGSASDADGSVVALEWRQFEGPAVLISDAGLETATFPAPRLTTSILLRFQLTATDDEGLSAGDEVNVLVQPVNAAPQVDAGDDQSLDDDVAAVFLVGTASDVDGSVVSSYWTQLSGPSVTIASAQSLSTSFVPPLVNGVTEIMLRLVVTDDEGAHNSDEVVIELHPSGSPNTSPSVTVGAAQEVFGSTIVVLEGQASDSDGSITGLQWLQVMGPSVSLAPTDQATTSFVAPVVSVPTTLLFRFIATDNLGATAFDQVLVEILPSAGDPGAGGNQPPIVDAGPPQSVAALDVVTLSAQASDADGTIASLSWLQLSGEPVTLSQASTLSASFVAPDRPTAQTLIFRLIVSDELGSTAHSDVEITVSAGSPLNEPPLVDAGPDRVAEGGLDDVLLGAISSDPDGTISSITWTQILGPFILWLPYPGAPNTVFFLAPAVTSSTEVVFSLEVVDDLGASSVDTVTITIVPQGPASGDDDDALGDDDDDALGDDDDSATGGTTNQAPIADAGRDQTARLGTVAFLSGSGSDPEGGFVSYLWTQVGGPTVALSHLHQPVTSFIAFGIACETDLTFELTVTDAQGVVASDETVVSIVPTNPLDCLSNSLTEPATLSLQLEMSMAMVLLICSSAQAAAVMARLMLAKRT